MIPPAVLSPHALQRLRACQLAVEYIQPFGFRAMRLKYVPGQSQASDAHLGHRLFRRRNVSTPATLRHSMPPGGVA